MVPRRLAQSISKPPDPRLYFPATSGARTQRREVRSAARQRSLRATISCSAFFHSSSGLLRGRPGRFFPMIGRRLRQRCATGAAMAHDDGASETTDLQARSTSAPRRPLFARHHQLLCLSSTRVRDSLRGRPGRFFPMIGRRLRQRCATGAAMAHNDGASETTDLQARSTSAPRRPLFARHHQLLCLSSTRVRDS